MKKILLIFLTLTLTTASYAQNKSAFGGGNGIYIFNPFDPCSAKKPNARGAVKYKLERRETGGSWQLLGTYACPVSEGELTNSYHLYYQFVLGKEFTNPNNILKLWQEYNRTPRWDSLGFFFYDRAAALAMCYQFIDSSARSRVPYEYQISELDRSDKSLASVITNSVSYPNNNVFPSAPKSVFAEGTQTQTYVQWKQENTSRPVFYKIYRKLGANGEFDFLQNAANISREKNTDKFTLEFRDRSIGANQLYFYYAVPYDGFGNSGKNSDTVVVKTYEIKDILAPQYFAAENMKGGKGVLLKWKLANTQSVAGIEVFRCDSYDGTYKKVGIAAESDTSFNDITASQAQVYYYYLQLIDRFQHTSIRTPRTSALFEEVLAPRPPRYVTATPQGEKVKLTWTTSEKNIAGYYVFRSFGHDSNYTLVSGFIPAKDSLTTYVDGTNDLKSQTGYSYAVKQENTSHMSSRFSYPAYLPSQLKASEAAIPMHLQVSAGQKGAMLFWDDMQNYNGVMGYKLLRRKKGESEFKPLLDDVLISASKNFFADSTIEQGNTYEYAVQTVLSSKNNSAMSDPVSFTYGSFTLTAPVGLILNRTETGVELNWDLYATEQVKEIQIFRAERGTSPLKLNTVRVGENKYTDLTTATGKSYFYYLVAVGNDGKESEKSDVVFITVE